MANKIDKLDFSQIFTLLKKELPDLQGIYLFGSYALGIASEKSDVDIAILCKKRTQPTLKYKLIEQLESLLNKNVDLIELRFVDTIFQEEILNSGKRIATFDRMACESYEDYIYCSAMDFREFRKPHVLEIIARGSVYG